MKGVRIFVQWIKINILLLIINILCQFINFIEKHIKSNNYNSFINKQYFCDLKFLLYRKTTFVILIKSNKFKTIKFQFKSLTYFILPTLSKKFLFFNCYSTPIQNIIKVTILPIIALNLDLKIEPYIMYGR